MEVIMSNCKKHPSCPHGPCLLFERYSSNGSKTGKRFFACSACRNRSDCSFFQWADEEISDKRKEIWEKIKNEKRVPFTHEEYMKRLEAFMLSPVDKRNYCKTCSLLVLDESKNHANHTLIEKITPHLIQPSSLIEIHENNKAEAQYFFSDNTVQFLVSLLKNLGFSKFISIGAPKIHEYVISKHSNELKSLLLDIDHRYMQFFSSEEFCHYNMFNNHFFSGEDSKKNFKNFLTESEDEKVVILLDPPFGGLIDAISYTLKKINKWWRRKNGKEVESMPILWVFPYFHEGRILKSLPDMKMMDYKVEYVNHKTFGKASSKMSPARIFTNIKASRFKLPTKQGHKFCEPCQRYVSEENQHCQKCNTCTTKHGKTYHHCDLCQQCVKSSHIHCQKCNKCGPCSAGISEICINCKCSSVKEGQGEVEKCFKCNGIGHRKRTCPEGIMRHNKKKRMQKKS